MSRKKLAIAGFLSAVLFFLVRDGFLAECGLDIVGNLKANFFLASAVIGLVIVGLLVTGKYKGWVASIPIICFATLIAIGISACNTSCKEKKKADNDSLTQKANEEAVRILANMMVKRVKDLVAQELGLSKEKSSSERPGNSVKILPGKKVQKKEEKPVNDLRKGWGYKSTQINNGK